MIYNKSKESKFTPELNNCHINNLLSSCNAYSTGEIKIVTAPTSNKPMPITQIPNNIGVTINSKRILELENEVSKLIK